MVKYLLEYITSAVSLFAGDGLVIHVLNEAQKKATTRVIIYQNTGAGAIVATDSGDTEVAPTWSWGTWLYIIFKWGILGTYQGYI